MIVTFTFSRRIGYYLINFYVPCIIMVIMSWIVFWMDRDCIGDRIALGITTVLTIVFLLGSSNSTMPRVSYPKAIDWYLMTSFIFVFTTLIMCLLIFRFDRQLGKQLCPPRSVSGEPPAEATSMQVLLELFRSKCCHNEITRLSGGEVGRKGIIFAPPLSPTPYFFAPLAVSFPCFWKRSPATQANASPW